VTVQTTPDLLTFAASPELLYGSATTTLSWTTDRAGRISISDESGELVAYNAGTDGQALLDAGSFEVTGIATTTTFTLRGWLAADGSGDEAFLTATLTVRPDPDLTLVANPTVFSGSADVTLHFNATVIVDTTTIVESYITDFDDDGDAMNGFDLKDLSRNFDTLLTGPPGDYKFEPLNGLSAGAQIEILSWSGTSIVVADDIGPDTTWLGDYRINTVSYSGADSLVINDGTSDIFTTTDPAVIANGSFTVTGVSADTTFTATASIGGGGATMQSVSVTANGTGSTYQETVLADRPVAYFPFNENATSTVIYDASGNGNHSTGITGTLTRGVPGAIGTAHRFNNNETITTGVTLDPADPDGDGGGSADLDGTEGFTMEALIRPDVAGFGIQHIWANTDGTGFGRSNLYLIGNGQVATYVGGGTTASQATGMDASWCHLAMTVSYDSARDLYVARTYLDGVLVDALDMVTGTGASRPPEFSDGAWVIGSHKLRTANNFWQGLLDEVALYDYALSDARIAAHNAAFLSNAVGLLAFAEDARVLRNEPYELFYKVGGGSTSATVDNGGGTVTPGTSGYVTVTPTEDTTYTFNVDGETRTATLQVVDPLVVADYGNDNGSGFPFLDVEGITEGISYQLLYSDNLQVWTVTGAPILGDASGTATFVDNTPFDNAARPGRFYQVRDIADPPAVP